MNFNEITINLKTAQGKEKFYINRCFDKIKWKCDGDKYPNNISEKCKNFICQVKCLCCSENKDFTFSKYSDANKSYDYDRRLPIIGVSKIKEIEEQEEPGTFKYKQKYLRVLKQRLISHCNGKKHKETFKIWEKAKSSRIEELQNPSYNNNLPAFSRQLYWNKLYLDQEIKQKKHDTMRNNLQNIIQIHNENSEITKEEITYLTTEEKNQLKEILKLLE